MHCCNDQGYPLHKFYDKNCDQAYLHHAGIPLRQEDGQGRARRSRQGGAQPAAAGSRHPHAGDGDHDPDDDPGPACRHAHDHTHAQAHDHDHPHSHSHAPQPGRMRPLQASERVGDHLRTQLRIRQMDCPTEEALIRHALGQRPDIKELEFDLIGRVLTLLHDPAALDSILQAIRELGFTPEQAGEESSAPPETIAPWWPLALAGLAALAAEIAHWAGTPWLFSAVLAVVAVLGSGLGTYRRGWTALRHGQMNINALMSIAVTGALVLGQWAEAAMVMVLFALAERIEARSLVRARQAVQGLLQLAPEHASVQQEDGQWQEIPATDVALGALVRVRPGERIALDGIVESGRSSVDQSPITGESIPVDKTAGDQVYTGTINGSGTLEFRVQSLANDSTLARIIRAIESAQSSRAPSQRFVDRFAQVYTPLVVLLALAIAIIPPLLSLGSWFDWTYRALVLLVIACPCALVISTPVTIVSGLAAAARNGVLVKGGVYLERGRLLKWLALDKTGTITRGEPSLVQSDRLADLPQAECDGLAVSLASQSDHPVSLAVAQGLADQAGKPVSEFEALPGRGVQALIAGQPMTLGNHRLIHERGLCSAALEARLEALESAGNTVVLLADSKRVLALYAVADIIKAESVQAVQALHDLGVRSLMLSGDNPYTVKAIADQVGIDRAEGNLLPEDKLQAIDALAQSGDIIGMVGDGINDAPALARADIGFAMGAMGTDVAIETADIALMDDDLNKIPWFIRLSQRTHGILVQNIALAVGIKLVFLVLTIIGLGTMWMAVFADVGASLLVVANGLRLLRFRAPARRAAAKKKSSLVQPA